MPMEQNEVHVHGDIVLWNKILDHVNAVCQLSLPDRTRMGSGFLAKCKIGGHEKTIILTNNHVVENKEMAKEFIVTFNFDGRRDPKSIFLCPDIFYKCSSSMEYDYTMIGVEKKDVDELKTTFQIFPVNLVTVKSFNVHSQKIYIPQHPKGGQKRFSFGEVREMKHNFIIYDADTAPGSSGAPVLLFQSGGCHVLALHKGSTRCSTNELANQGIFINIILGHANDEPLQQPDRTFRPDPPFTEKELSRIGQRIPEYWGEVGLATGMFASYEIDNMRVDNYHCSPASKAIAMLISYKNRLGSRKNLMEALTQFGYRDLARKVQNQYFKIHVIE